MGRAYDQIGVHYAQTRLADPRIAGHIDKALGDSASVVNVGAGTGSYEPIDRIVVAVEPSRMMIRQRRVAAALVLQAVAEKLPLVDDAVDAALAILTVHHWNDPEQGLIEMRRVARKRIVVLTWDQDVCEDFWLIREYFPSISELDRRRAVAIPDIVSALGGGQIITILIPHDCVDGFLGAYWRRPEAYLRESVLSGISSFSAISPKDRASGLGQLAADIDSGAWDEQHAKLAALDELDLGYRLVIA